ncbi:hypothetical protein PMAYCL1PPCAC_17100, partial [Pristionchus mayeri]
TSMNIFPPLSVFYFSVDAGLVLTLFGFFNSSTFEVRRVVKLLNPLTGYSLSSSPLDFLVISAFRILINAYTNHLGISGKSSQIARLDKPVATFSVVCVSFSFLKCLLYSEQPVLHDCAGTYFLPAWNLISTVIFYRLWLNDFEANVGNTAEERKKKDEEQNNEEIQLSKIKQIALLMKYSLAKWPWLLIGMLLSLTSASVNVATPHYTSQVMNGITSLREGVDINHSITMLAVLTFASMVLTGLKSGSFSYLTSIIVSKMRKDLFNSIVSQEIAFFDKHKSGEIIARLTSDTRGLSYQLTDMFTGTMKSVLTLVGKILVMGALSWRLTLVNFIAFPIIIYVTKLYSDFYEKMCEQGSDTNADSHQVAGELISNIRTMRSFGAEKRASERFARAIDEAQRVSRKESLLAMGFHCSYDLYYNVIYVVVLIYGARLVSAGSLEAAALVTFMMYQQDIGGHIVGLTYEIPQFMGFLGESRKFCELLVRKPRIRTDGTNMQPVKYESSA